MMKKDKIKAPEKKALRRQAEKQLTKNQDNENLPATEAEIHKLLHELQVHQIELEMMNEELRLSRDKAEVSAEKYEELYNFAPFGYLTLQPEGTISELNFRTAHMLGIERHLILNKNLRSFVSRDSKHLFDEFLKKVFEGNEKASCELKLKAEGNSSVLVYLEGKISGTENKCTLTMIDITERMTLEALKRSNAELEQFAYVASHDLQEPLRMISYYTQLLERQFGNTLDDKTRHYIEFIVDGAKRMNTLIHGLLSYSRITSQKEGFALTDLNIVIDQVLQDLKLAVAESKAKIKVDRLPEVMAVTSQMHQLFQNRIENAIKFRGKDNPVIYISAERKGRTLAFCVKDNGIGIDPEYFEKIFLIFQRLHDRETYPGTGIGLSVCKRIVEYHGGRIWVNSQAGNGAEFYFTIPA